MKASDCSILTVVDINTEILQNQVCFFLDPSVSITQWPAGHVYQAERQIVTSQSILMCEQLSPPGTDNMSQINVRSLREQESFDNAIAATVIKRATEVSVYLSFSMHGSQAD